MAEASNSSNLPTADLAGGMPGLADNPWLRQIAVMVGIAASVALGVAVVLWSRFLIVDPDNPTWADRDRFVLSNGHGSMLLYSLLHLSGYDLGIDELKAFRQLGQRTAGHPEYEPELGIETTTGPLGQGLANAVGMALGERVLSARYNRPGHEVIDHYSEGLVYSETIDPLMKAVGEGGVQLSDSDKADLKVFLLILSDPSFVQPRQ